MVSTKNYHSHSYQDVQHLSTSTSITDPSSITAITTSKPTANSIMRQSYLSYAGI